MSGQTIAPSELPVTPLTFIRFFSSVRVHMVPQATPVSEPCTTLVTWKRFFALVRCTNMSRQSIASREQHVTLVACKRFLRHPCGAPLILAFLFCPFLRLKLTVDATLHTQNKPFKHTHAHAHAHLRTEYFFFEKPWKWHQLMRLEHCSFFVLQAAAQVHTSVEGLTEGFFCFFF